MKIKFLKKLMLFLTISFFAVCCALKKPENLKPEAGRVVLEVTNNYRGIRHLTGEMLQLRLFDDGIVEYDHIPKQPSKSLTNSKDIKITSQTKIDETKVKAIIDLLSAKDFVNAKESYASNCCCGTDAFVETKIQSFLANRQKVIIVASHCGDLKNADPSYFPNLPTVISQLDRKIWEIQSKIASDNFYKQQSIKN